MCVCVCRYDNTSAQVKALENKAGRVSGEAKGESKMADGMLKHIAAMEKQIPDGLKVTAAATPLQTSHLPPNT